MQNLYDIEEKVFFESPKDKFTILKGSITGYSVTPENVIYQIACTNGENFKSVKQCFVKRERKQLATVLIQIANEKHSETLQKIYLQS